MLNHCIVHFLLGWLSKRVTEAENMRLPSLLWLTWSCSILGGCVAAADFPASAVGAQVSLAMIYLQQGNFAQARLTLNEVLAHQPHVAAGWGAMGYLEETCGNLALAARNYRYAVKLSPRDGNTHNNYGVFLCRHGSPRAGIQELLLAAQLPTYIDRAAAYTNAARCAQSIPDPASAKLYLESAHRNGKS